jgi:hypothetical protein
MKMRGTPWSQEFSERISEFNKKYPGELGRLTRLLGQGCQDALERLRDVAGVPLVGREALELYADIAANAVLKQRDVKTCQDAENPGQLIGLQKLKLRLKLVTKILWVKYGVPPSPRIRVLID